MTIDCKWMGSLYDEDDHRIEGTELTDGNGWEVGWCFFWGYQLSNHYKENVASVRQPITVCLPMNGKRGWKTPDGIWPVNFCIDSFPTSDPNGNWDVQVDLSTLVLGQKPDITVAPSIHCVGLYHGYLQHGVISDDLGG